MSATALDPESHFAAHGWCVLRGVYTAPEVAAWRDASEVLLPDAVVPWDDIGVPLTVRPSRQMEALGAWLQRETAFRMAARLLGAPGVRLLQDALLVKLPHAPHDLAWHRDARYFGYLEPISVVSVRLALTDETVETGCLHTVDGSHLAGQLPRAGADDAFTAARVQAAAVDHEGAARPVPLRAGDVSIHHCQTLHASFGNSGFQARRTLVAHVASSDVRVVAERLRPDLIQWFPTDSGGRLDPATFWELPRR